MYNLFVDSDINNWDGNPTWLPIDRFLTYTNSDLRVGIDLMMPETLQKLKSLPCIFSYELKNKKDAFVGWINEIRVKDKKVHYSYTLEPNVEQIPWDFFEKHQWDFDIDEWEMNTTHWALKKVDLKQILLKHKFIDSEFEFSRGTEKVYFNKPMLGVIKPALAILYSTAEIDSLFKDYGFPIDVKASVSNKTTRVAAYLDYVNWSESENVNRFLELCSQVHNQNGHLIKLGEDGQTSNQIFHMVALHEVLEKNGIKWNGSSYVIDIKKTNVSGVLNSLTLKNLSSIPTAFSDYKAIRVIGGGGSGRVYEVENADKEKLALKVLIPEKINSDKISRFRNEIFFSLKNIHPNIIKVIDIGFLTVGDRKCPFYVMPLMQASFRDVLIQEKDITKKLKLFLTFIEGLIKAHSLNCWHRDIKPENILYDSINGILVLSDFGIAHIHEDFIIDDVETKDKSQLANFKYASPEQRNRGGRVDSKSDIYSTGLILNEIFTGEIPWGADHLSITDISAKHSSLDMIINRMLQHDVAKRTISLAEVVEAIIKTI